MPIKIKSAGILCGFRAFLPQIGGDKRLLEAIYHYGALPKCRCQVFDRGRSLPYLGPSPAVRQTDKAEMEYKLGAVSWKLGWRFFGSYEIMLVSVWDFRKTGKPNGC